MSKKTEKPVTSNKKVSKYHEKFAVDATFEELVKLAATTQIKKAKKAA